MALVLVRHQSLDVWISSAADLTCKLDGESVLLCFPLWCLPNIARANRHFQNQE